MEATSTLLNAPSSTAGAVLTAFPRWRVGTRRTRKNCSSLQEIGLNLKSFSTVNYMMPTSVFNSLRFISHIINALSELIGKLTAWLILIMVLIVVYDVSMRTLFQRGSVALQEWQWHLFALIFLLGAAYTSKYDEHVRVDIIYQSRWMTTRSRAWINLLGDLLFLIPFCLLIIHSSWAFVYDAYVHLESSPDSGGLPYRFLLKAAIPIGFTLLLLQGLANALTNLLYLMGYEEK
jgi:TRAP-type mannitol/chloroaromatic compound transport system permease small subunit